METKINIEIERYTKLIEEYKPIIIDAINLGSYEHAKECIETVIEYQASRKALVLILTS
jgi:hypothetical protein